MNITYAAFGIRLELHDFTVYTNIENEPDGNQCGDDGSAAAGKKRQGDTGNRHESHGHGDIFENLEQEHADKAHYNQCSVQILGIPDNAGKTPIQQPIKQDYAEASEKTQFLSDHGEDEV